MSNHKRGPMRGMPAMRGGEKARDFKGTMKKLLHYLGTKKIQIFIVFIFAVISTVFNIVGPKILGKATTKVFEGVMGKIAGTTAGIDFVYVGKILIILVCLYVVSAIFSYLQSHIMTGVTTELTYNLRKDISHKINTLPLKYYDKQQTGEVLSRITNDVDTINQNLNQGLTQIITSITTVIGVLIMMASIDITMTIIALLIIPISSIFIMTVIHFSQKYFRSQQEYLGHVNGHIEEMYSGHSIVKAFNREKQSINDFNEYNDTLYHSAWKSQFLSGMMQPIMSFISNLGYVAICILGGYRATKGFITVGDIQAFIQYVRNFTQPITQLANVSNILQQTAAAAERVFEFLDEEDEKETTTAPKEVNLNNVKGSVEFEHVYFGYDENKPIIKDFSSKVKPGQKIAIVGPTGAGKTTIVKLLMRFYDINSGSIKVDGVNINDYKRRDLRKMFGMVLQDTWLYNDTVMNNIRYGNLNATDEDVEQAAIATHVDHFIKTNVDGYQMILNEEASNISSGQKQLLTIARALLADPKILILDEATSSVDTRTEKLIVKAMDTLVKGRTSFIIAHRLSTIKDADLILVMNEGNIIEQGTHDELMKENGFYSNLYNSQFEE
ncbi:MULTISPECIES: ABC transporter ATP-binding protein [Anaerofustis]|uniref:ABC transporter ATP-binding protein n=1 Tax=Anaerofustis TaxID=264995 RepID=UPI001106F1A2|nr:MULTISPECIES: ABC transporter ATP-binding protein [Anaerofustis]MCO8194051.1 ABC transporter ATP-binding protein/permease [Anaerofustis sp. NSJ-163]